MVPNYSGKLLDKLIVIAVQQTSAVQPNVDQEEYPEVRATVMKALVRALWKGRTELQIERDPDFKP